MQQASFGDQFGNVEDASALAQGIVDTVREPVLVLDSALRVIAASRSFYTKFKVGPEETMARLLYTLGDGQWDVPQLRALLEGIIPERGKMDDYEVEHDFPLLCHRTMCLNACQVFHQSGATMPWQPDGAMRWPSISTPDLVDHRVGAAVGPGPLRGARVDLRSGGAFRVARCSKL